MNEEARKEKRELELEEAKFESRLAELRKGLVSIREIQTKQIILWCAGLIVFILLIGLIVYLFSIAEYTYGIILVFFLMAYSLSFLALHNSGIRKIILSSKDLKIEK